MPFSHVLAYLESKGWKLIAISNFKLNRQFKHSATGGILSVPVVDKTVLASVWREVKAYADNYDGMCGDGI
jgi:hypothetical protein